MDCCLSQWNDRNSGCDTARIQGRSGKAGPITITIRAETYYLREMLFLGPEDSDTIWEAPHGEHPVISRSRVISDWAKDAGAASWG